ncbi:hypothetical protein ACFC7A_19270 [Streptomyces niveus]|uniref:hypothetical protein n=1 Tax=Streptomyces niveus TaxID=193462 RepID=UPI0035DECDDD
MQRERAETYAQSTADLELAATAAAAAGAFDTALTNGLAAIVAHEWPAQLASNGRIKSAAALLKVVEEADEAPVDPAQAGVFVLPDPEPDKPAAAPVGVPWPWVEDFSELPALDTRIDVETLRDGLRRTQPVRHARGSGTLERRHIDALLALDDHPALRCLSSEHADRAWEESRDADAHSQARAAALLLRIGDKEAARRAEAAAELHEPYHPKHNPDGLALQDCPVCGYESFSPEHGDDYGMDVGVGQCLVCHYERSAQTAADEAEAQIFAARWAD